MTLILLSTVLILLAGVVAILPALSTIRASQVSMILGTAGAGVGLVPCLMVLAGSPSQTMEVPWEMPMGSFALHLGVVRN